MKLIFPSMDYPQAGGTENVVVEIAREATRRSAADIVIMGSQDAYVVHRLQELSVPFQLVLDTDFAKFRSVPDDLFVHFCNHKWLPRLAHLPGRALVWCLLAHLVTRWNRFNFEQRWTGHRHLGNWLNRKFIRNLKSRNALLAMDGATAESIDAFAGGFATSLLPIPIQASLSEISGRRQVSRPEPIVVTYIGRSDDVWKIYPARKLVRDLGMLPFPAELEIFTDDSRPFEAMLNGLQPANVYVRYTLGVFGQALRERIAQRSTLHVSMGMSALEGALAGVPTALIDPSYSDLPEHYKYKWLWETPSFSLARFITEKDTVFAGHSLDALIKRSVDPRYRDEDALRCINHVVEHHSPERIVGSLIASQTIATNLDLVRWTPATFPLIQTLGAAFFQNTRGTKP